MSDYQKGQLFDLTKGALPIITVVSLMGGTSGFALWLNGKFADIGYRLTTIEQKIGGLGNGHVHEDDLRLWIERVRVKNPSLALPDF